MAQDSTTDTVTRTTSGPAIGWQGAQKVGRQGRYRWQKDWTKQTAWTLYARERWRRIRIALFFSGALGLLALLLYYLLFAPARTPMLAVAITDYDWPLPPNAWATEDLASFRDLDRQVLHVVDASNSWETPQRGLRALEQQLELLRPQAIRAGALIVYLSMHGAVDEAGEPCLIPATASPLASETWLPLRSVLDRIAQQKLPRSTHVLVVLDCNRQLANWNLGILHNTFADSLSHLIGELKMPNLVLLNSTSPGQRGHAAAELQTSVFAHYLHLALAGAADQSRFGGNRNGRVSIRELTHYLQTHVDRWSLHFCGDHQRPLLVPVRTRNFEISWSLGGRALRRLLDRVAQQPLEAKMSIPWAQREPLWTARDRLRDLSPERFDPLAWRDLEHRMLWLEQLARSGSAYEARAVEVEAELKQRLDEIGQRAEAARLQRSLIASSNVLRRGWFELPQQVALADLALAELCGTLTPQVLQQIRTQWQSLADSPSAVALQEAVAGFEALDVVLAETQFVRFLQRYRVLEAWPQSSEVGAALALRARVNAAVVPAARDVLPGDERVHYWARAVLNAADERRRASEDALWAGAAAEGAGAMSPAQAVAETGAMLFAAGIEGVTGALDFRDRATARLPYLAQWLCRPQPQIKLREDADSLVRQALLPLIENLQGLDAGLERDEGDLSVAASVVPWADAALQATAAQRFALLEKQLDESLGKLYDSRPDDVHALREIEYLLALPLLDANQRRSLLDKRAVVFGERVSEFDPLAASGPTLPADAAHQELIRVDVHWTKHPATALLERVPSGPPPDLMKAAREETERQSHERQCRNLARLEADVRRRLRGLSNDAILYGRPAEAGTEEAPLTRSRREAALRWADCCRAESLLRSAAALAFDPPVDDPIRTLRRFDLQQLLIWQAYRALEDFTGSGGSSSAPLFATAATNYLRLAESLITPNAQVSAQIQNLEAVLAARRGAAEQGLAVAATDLLLVEPSAIARTELVVQREGNTAATAFPAGSAVTYLADSQGRFQETASLFEPRTLEQPQRWEHLLPGAELASRGPSLEAMALFRGHEFTAPLLLRAAGGYRYDVSLGGYGPPRVSLFGARRRRASVVFVLDCSHSMDAAMAIEAPGTTTTTDTTRLDVAKNALRRLLDQLSDRGDSRVGVWFFGHRVGWSTQEANKLLRQTRYAAEIPSTLQPFADVEQILPLGRFDSVIAGRVADRLESVRPWGESPLYLALTECLQEFSGEGAAGEQSIVVITDGVNNQFNPAVEYLRTRGDVVDAAEGKNVRIHIIGFGVAPDEQAEARREFETITNATGGEYFSATNAAALVQSLESLLQPNVFTVQDARGQTEATAQVGSTVSLDRIANPPQPYYLTFETIEAELPLSNGDAAALSISPDGARLVVAPLAPPGTKSGRLVSGAAGTPVGASLFAHRPIRDPRGVNFTFSWQREDQAFLARPAEVWFEIRPHSGEANESLKYVYYDPSFLADKTGPQLGIVAENWPASARLAEVRMWCKPTPTSPDFVLDVRAIANQPPPSGDGFVYPQMPGVSLQVRTLRVADAQTPLRVVVIERHHEESRGVDALRLEMSPRPVRVERQFDPANGVVLHTFHYTGSDVRELDAHQLEFTARASVHADAWRLEETILVNVADKNDLLEVK